MDGPTSSKNKRPDDLETRLHKVSLVVSVLALGLMIGGFVGTALQGLLSALPGGSVLPFSAYAHPGQAPAGLFVMSAGILLLVLLPTMRVLLALLLYARQRGFLNAVVALLVLLELLISMRGAVG